ncbi:MAG: hypothetical protein MJZ25_06305 [Fibrobacter sp.]|nr:hypothetical protein [Fibrobacter sp.]
MDAFGVTGCGSVMEKCEHFSATLTLHGTRTHFVSSRISAYTNKKEKDTVKVSFPFYRNSEIVLYEHL